MVGPSSTHPPPLISPFQPTLLLLLIALPTAVVHCSTPSTDLFNDMSAEKLNNGAHLVLDGLSEWAHHNRFLATAVRARLADPSLTTPLQFVFFSIVFVFLFVCMMSMCCFECCMCTWGGMASGFDTSVVPVLVTPHHHRHRHRRRRHRRSRSRRSRRHEDSDRSRRSVHTRVSDEPRHG